MSATRDSRRTTAAGAARSWYAQRSTNGSRGPPDDRGSNERYDTITEGLESSPNSLCEAGAFGETFAKQSTHRIDATTPMAFDLSRIAQAENDLRAAALMACWSAGFGTVTTSNMLADDGVIERQRFLVILDELWNTLAAGPGIVDQVNALTRLNREWGAGQIMASHTPSDLKAVKDEADRHKVQGIMDWCGIKILGGLARTEMPLLTQSVPLRRRLQLRDPNTEVCAVGPRRALQQFVQGVSSRLVTQVPRLVSSCC